MPKVVKVNARQADRFESGHPRSAVEVAVTLRFTRGAGEDEDRRRAEPVEVLPQIGRDESGERDDPAADPSAGLGRW
jgi:hypothetical protein